MIVIYQVNELEYWVGEGNGYHQFLFDIFSEGQVLIDWLDARNIKYKSKFYEDLHRRWSMRTEANPNIPEIVEVRKVITHSGGLRLTFENKDDAMLFKLTWQNVHYGE